MSRASHGRAAHRALRWVGAPSPRARNGHAPRARPTHPSANGRGAARVTVRSSQRGFWRTPTQRSYPLRFLAYDLALHLIRNPREPLAAIRRHDAALAKQARDALNSVAMNIAEGSGRNGGDRQQFFAIAFGSLRELGCALDIGAAHGWLGDASCFADRDRLASMLWSLKRR